MNNEDIQDAILRNSVPYTREDFDRDVLRLSVLIAARHNIEISEVHQLIVEHRYEHTNPDYEDEYIQAMSMGRWAGWVS